MAYIVKFSPAANEDIYKCVDYLAHALEGVGNPLVARKFLEALTNATELIADFPEGMPLCDDPELRAAGVRKIRLGHYRYNLFYHIVDETIIVDMVCHHLQDYEEKLSGRVGV